MKYLDEEDWRLVGVLTVPVEARDQDLKRPLRYPMTPVQVIRRL